MSNSFVESRAHGTGYRFSSLWAAVIVPVGRQFERINHWRLVRRDIDRLMEFDDSELKDIGLERGDVMYAVRFGRLPEDRVAGRL